MRREEMADLTAFVVVAEERSFTRAATKLGMSQSAISQIVRRLEERLGVRLLTRTTRSVAPTQAGERLLATFSPMLHHIDRSIEELSEFRDKPAGHIRITAPEHAVKTVIMPALHKLLPKYPDIQVSVVSDYGLTDLVAERFDFGVRIGEQVSKDMISVRISPDFSMAIVASPQYFEEREKPETCKDLIEHQCINLWQPTLETTIGWRLLQDGKRVIVQVEGQLICNTLEHITNAALNGLGLAYLPLDLVEEHIATGRLLRVLESHVADLSGYHLYFPNRRHSTPAFKLLINALRYRA